MIACREFLDREAGGRGFGCGIPQVSVGVLLVSVKGSACEEAWGAGDRAGESAGRPRDRHFVHPRPPKGVFRGLSRPRQSGNPVNTGQERPLTRNTANAPQSKI